MSSAAGSRRVWSAIALGGALGTAARYGMDLILPADPISIGNVVVNIVGAFVLGAMVARPMRDRAAAFWRTGVLGAFTTFGAMTVQTAELGPIAGPGYVIALVLAGLAAAVVGLRLGRRGGGTT